MQIRIEHIWKICAWQAEDFPSTHFIHVFLSLYSDMNVT